MEKEEQKAEKKTRNNKIFLVFIIAVLFYLIGVPLIQISQVKKECNAFGKEYSAVQCKKGGWKCFNSETNESKQVKSSSCHGG